MAWSWISWLVACTGTDVPINDTAPPPGTEWDHCPSETEWVGEDTWEGELIATNGALYCEYPLQHQEMTDALTNRSQLRIVPGSYPIPLTGEDQDFYLPICLLDETGPLPGTVQGTATGNEVTDMTGEQVYWTTATQGREDGSGELTLLMETPVGETSLRIDGQGAFQQGLSLQSCVGETCYDADDSVYAPCSFAPTTCDRFTLADGNELALDQYHWVGMVGSGFGAVTEARGLLDGTAFAITDYWQLVMTFGHHAFDRDALLFFDAPIGEACGLWVDEVTANSAIWTVDCSGAPLQQLDILEQVHEYQEGPCPS